jgi:hypothetical protein
MRIEDKLTDVLVEGLKNKLDEILIDGLKLKGYEFENNSELIEFITEYCTSEDYSHISTRYYYVKGELFLMHNYEPDFDFSDSISLKATYGKYKFM